MSESENSQESTQESNPVENSPEQVEAAPQEETKQIETQESHAQNEEASLAKDESEQSEEKNEDGSDESKDQETPEWFMKDKYSSIEEQARAAYELQKKMGKFWGPPKDDYNLESIEGVSKDDPLLENIIPAVKDLGLSQEGFQNLVKQYQDANMKMMKKFEDELKEELTVKDANTYHAVDKWMNENLSAEEKEQVQNNWLMTPKDFQLFNQMRLMAAPSTSVPNSSEHAAKFESSKEVEHDKIKYKKEVNQGLRVPDKNYENELAQRFRDARTRELRSKR